jgi:alkanesulfonate monooxygenase SsuD/methylene tetrahydromethanopterin reductase-like flavin-dependent oxidoreductase (luciferase family)
LYNRLKLDSREYFESIGFTEGWGHFHVPDELFDEMRRYLGEQGHRYANGHRFGQGPNWRLRTIRAALDALGLNPDILRHGVGREVFLGRLATNAEAVLRGDARRPNYSDLRTVAEVGKLAVERWIVPRASRQPEYRDWQREGLWQLIRDSAGHGAIVAKPGELADRK